MTGAVNTPARLEAVNGITSDEPTLLRAVLDR